MPQIKASQAIRNAIESELASVRFYETLADRTRFPAAREFLRQMVAVELSHAAEIEGLAEQFRVGALPEHTDRDVSMVETLPHWGGTEAVTLPEGIAIAISAERAAARYYRALAGQLAGAAKDLFLRIARTEDEHVRTLVGQGSVPR